MKRTAPTQDYPSKRTKIDGDLLFDEPNTERDPRDILQNGLVDCSGYISCTCFMTWRPTKKHRAILEHTDADPKCLFEVEFIGACADFFHDIELKARDVFQLSLKGARVVNLAKSSLPKGLPIKLIYEDGVVIKFLQRARGPCRRVDTWELKEAQKAIEDDWFLTQPAPTRQAEMQELAIALTTAPKPTSFAPPIEAAPIVASRNGHTNTSLPISKAGSSTSKEDTPQREQLQPAVSTSISDDPVEKLSKRKRRELKKQARDAIHRPESIPAVSITTNNSTPAADLSLPTTVHRISQAIPAPYVPRPAPPAPPHVPKVDPPETRVVSPTRSAGPSGLTTSSLVDPTNTDVDNLNGTGSFQLNCFTKRYAQWLPQPKLGEILIVHDIRITNYQGNPMGVGYKDKMQWAIYTPATRKIRHGDLGDAPEAEGVDEGLGYRFSPFIYPEDPELAHCLKLTDWWSEVEKHRKSVNEVHQVAAVSTSTRPQRMHRLISEAGPDVHPSGYFDCTVEVLHGHVNDTNVYSLYVTDYTVNEAITPTEADWCPRGLADRVLKIEMWDAAREYADMMFVGEYYSIKNARMRLSRGGYVEGKLAQNKTRKLVVEEDGKIDQHFKALLERKRAWQEANPDNGNEEDAFEYSTIDSAVEGKHFNCVVEVLHGVYEVNGTSCIYVTDYTSRDELLSTKAQGNWGDRLQGRILRIALFTNQAEMAKTVEPKSFYTIKKLRVKQSTTARQFQGQLGGAERLITLLKPGSGDEHLERLKERKEEWKRSRETPTIAGAESFRGHPGRDHREDIPKQAPESNPRRTGFEPTTSSRAIARCGKTIAEMKAGPTCPNKTRLSARVVDFRPWDLHDATYLYCSNCNKDVPKNLNGCTDCYDFDLEYVRCMYQMYLSLEDEDGGQVHVSLPDESSVFDGLNRADVREDVKGLKALSEHLRRKLGIGNLLRAHESPFSESALNNIPETPMLSLIIDSWEVEGKRAYRLVDCEE
ncbi:hypothetical protein DXG03_007160 [Asterophora parasitica]|uniref:Protection of telomeres protein 1 ssDNA-binding domain-containing protein n=1 Tax=Asterophora parasitica TaxID=117018 RepID=A0A9P7GD19_9AGAR|nr:hypothetical protein DXG03_007160 [Asterophora parasitica]